MNENTNTRSKSTRLNILESVKWLTQRITMIIAWTIWIFIVPFVYARLLGMTPILQMIDGLYWGYNERWYYVLFFISRCLFSVAWVLSAYKLVDLGTTTGFFWFKKERQRYEEESIDKSGEIFFYIIFFGLFGTIFAELAIRFYTGAVPFYVAS
ncbi:hypothetical protein BH09PAT2_BH09PAT2_10260 [soil metagenome]